MWWLGQRTLLSNQRHTTQIIARHEEIAGLHSQLVAIQLEKERLEEALDESKDDVGQALQARTSFLNNIGHELRTRSLLFSATQTSFCRKQNRKMTNNSSCSPKNQTVCQRIRATINDVLQMVEIESGQVGFLLEAFGIETVIDQAVIQSQAYLDVNENDFMLIVSPDIGTMVADRDKIRSILGNLLSNASKFTKNGSITLSANQAVIDDQPWIIFQVADTGVGIPRTTSPHFPAIFAGR